MTALDAGRLVAQLRTAALLYASRGWHVFPLIPGEKRPACPGHPAARCDRSDPWCRRGHQGWEQRATTSDPRIHRAWSSTPTESASPADRPGCWSSTPTSPSPATRPRPPASRPGRTRWPGSRPGTGPSCHRPTPSSRPRAERTATWPSRTVCSWATPPAGWGRWSTPVAPAATSSPAPRSSAGPTGSSTAAARRCCPTGWPNCSPPAAARPERRPAARRRLLSARWPADPGPVRHRRPRR